MSNNTQTTISKSIFQEPWWMDITARGKWAELSTETKFGYVKFVYAIRNRYRILKEIYLPPLTPYTGIYFDFDKVVNAKTKYKILSDAVPQLVQQLPKYARLKTNMLPDFDWWSPFYWEGFHQHTRYTSLLTQIKDHDAIWSGFSNNVKRNIRKAQKTISVTSGFDCDTLYDLFSKTMHDQGKRPGYSRAILASLCIEIEERRTGMVLIARDQNGTPHAGVLLVWDSHTAYYLIGGTDPALRSSGAMPLAMWTAIQSASEFVDKYDFEGSMQKGIDRFVRSFGAIPVPYSSISDGLFANKIVRQKVKKAV
jgi:hypothetical protein